MRLVQPDNTINTLKLVLERVGVRHDCSEKENEVDSNLVHVNVVREAHENLQQTVDILPTYDCPYKHATFAVSFRTVCSEGVRLTKRRDPLSGLFANSKVVACFGSKVEDSHLVLIQVADLLASLCPRFVHAGNSPNLHSIELGRFSFVSLGDWLIFGLACHVFDFTYVLWFVHSDCAASCAPELRGGLRGPAQLSMSETYYFVRNGRTSGICNTLEEALARVAGFPGADIRVFRSKPDAEAYAESTDGQTCVGEPPSGLCVFADYICIPGQVYLQISILAGCVQYRGRTIIVSKRGRTFELVGKYLAVIEPLIAGDKMPGPLDSVWSAKMVESTEIIHRRRFSLITIRLRSGRRWELYLKPFGARFVKSITYRTKKVLKPVGPLLSHGRRLDKEVETEDETDADDPNCPVFE